MPKTAKLIGGAGTGKTHRLMITLDRLLDSGLDPLEIGFVSFTRAARAEAVARAADRLRVPPTKLERRGWFRTLHSICYRLLGIDGELLTDCAADRQWITEAIQEPVETLGTDLLDDGAPTSGPQTQADVALKLWSAARNRLVPLAEIWEQAYAMDRRTTPDGEWCEEIIERYEESKQNDDRLDFTDMLLRVAGVKCRPAEGLEQSEPEGVPPKLTAWIHDEAQDCSALTWAVFQRLIHTATVRYVYLAGDPFQAIYNFAGSDARCFLDSAADKTEIMGQSYRCPADILGLGERILEVCTNYFPRHIKPAGHPGTIDECDHYNLAGEVDPKADWLVLARSSRLVSALCRQLDEAALPWRPTRGKGPWSSSIRTNAIRTLAAMQRGEPIRPLDWRDVLKTLPVKGRFARGAKQYWTVTLPAERLREMPAIVVGDWLGIGITEQYAQRIHSGIWTEDLKDAKRYLEAVETHGQEVVDKPRLRIGTIHSAKGAEAENVAVLTSMPSPSVRALAFDDLRDAEQRVWYVATTRAKRRLLVIADLQAEHKKGLPL